MADLSNTTFTAITDTETDAKSPFHVTLAQGLGKDINYLKAQADLFERAEILAYASLALRGL